MQTWSGTSWRIWTEPARAWQSSDAERHGKQFSTDGTEAEPQGKARKPQRQVIMLFFVMYDIESNKVRRTVATYLEKKGRQRIQKSVYLANLDSSVYEQIRSDLTEVQGMYENNDSIIFCQASVDELKSMDVIGHNLDLDLVLKGRNTMFF